jgi:basic amino acid/polyamine antiporter, APA family
VSGPSRTVNLGPACAATLGAGVLVGIAPAASVAGAWLLAGMVLAAAVAAVVSTVDVKPRLGRAGTGIGLAGRLAGATAVAGAFGVYVVPDSPALGAAALVVVVAAARLAGVRVPPWLPAVGAIVVVGVLAAVVLACLAIEPAGQVVAPPPDAPGADDPIGILAAAVVCYPAFLGAGRDRVAVGVVLVVGLVVAVAALRQLGGPRLALSPAPLRDALAAADGAAITPLLAVGVTVATALVLHALLDGLSADLPGRPALATAAAAVALAVVVLTPVTALVVAAVLMLLAAVLGHGKRSDPK